VTFLHARTDNWIRWTTTGCVAMLALIAGTVSYLHMHVLAELHGQPGWAVALTPFSVDGMIVHLRGRLIRRHQVWIGSLRREASCYLLR
jgi:Protein of unknown function (DUF2637)